MRYGKCGLIFLIPFLVITIAHAAFGEGGDHPNGGDTIPLEYDSGWFLGEGNVVHACIQVDPKFGLSLSTIQDVIQKGFAAWRDYFNAKEGPAYIQEKALHPAFQVSFVATCQGNEDLTFYLGVTNPQVEQAKKRYFNPDAFAERTQYSTDKGWGKGFVWVSGPRALPLVDWTVPDAFNGIILHEMGHVFGCEHVPGTVMSEDIVKLLYTGSLMTKIDGAKELVLANSGSFDFGGYIGSDSIGADYTKTFKLFSGRDSSGLIIAHLTVTSVDGQLTYTDSIGSVTIPITLTQLGRSFDPKGKAFKAVGMVSTPTGPVKMATWIPAGQGMVRYGFVKDVSGKPYAIILTRNSNPDINDSKGPVALEYFGPALATDLFQAFSNL